MINVERDVITSRQNPTVMRIAKLQNRKHRELEHEFVIDGEKLFYEAVDSGLDISIVALSQSYGEKTGAVSNICEKLDSAGQSKTRVIIVADGAFEKLTTEKSPQGIITVAKTIDFFEKYNKIYNNEKFLNKPRNTIMLCTMQNPGNLGTVIRSAAAFEIDAVYVTRDCADLFSPKTLRGAMGALFKQPIRIIDDAKEHIKDMQAQGVCVCAAALDRNAVGLDELEANSDGVCFVIGNEGNGLPDDIIDASDKTVFIPMAENTESLNASIASAVLMWELFKNKRK